ncbi:MAG: hypothetical protein IJE08_12335 [Clostridia bacterium]|nr:hypothetical protein [Clostridia bacterium]
MQSARAFIELCYAEEGKPTGRAEPYGDAIIRDAAFDPAILSSIPARFSAVVQWPGEPTEADAKDLLIRIKSVLEENGLPMSHYSLVLSDGSDNPGVSTGIVLAKDIG